MRRHQLECCRKQADVAGKRLGNGDRSTRSAFECRRSSELTCQALTLLEFLIKNGSERVVDDARAHVSTIKMLRSFHYIDEKGKDQGINGEWRYLPICERRKLIKQYAIVHPRSLHYWPMSIGYGKSAEKPSRTRQNTADRGTMEA